ncbi:MAG: hypothetical protein HKO83_15140 [Ignavibacteriaceae bacterium]|nr:hypothetical protein [Ignavibacteria bacterium]NNL22653.1 hypothetical protein [Ignavibacteriaceae bacterium]
MQISLGRQVARDSPSGIGEANIPPDKSALKIIRSQKMKGLLREIPCDRRYGVHPVE